MRGSVYTCGEHCVVLLVWLEENVGMQAEPESQKREQGRTVDMKRCRLCVIESEGNRAGVR